MAVPDTEQTTAFGVGSADVLVRNDEVGESRATANSKIELTLLTAVGVPISLLDAFLRLAVDKRNDIARADAFARRTHRVIGSELLELGGERAGGVEESMDAPLEEAMLSGVTLVAACIESVAGLVVPMPR